MYGMLLACFGFTMYIFGVLLAVPRNLLNGGKGFLAFNEWVVWYSGVPVVLGLSLALVDLFLLLGHKRSPRLEEIGDRTAAPEHAVDEASCFVEKGGPDGAVKGHAGLILRGLLEVSTPGMPTQESET